MVWDYICLGGMTGTSILRSCHWERPSWFDFVIASVDTRLFHNDFKPLTSLFCSQSLNCHEACYTSSSGTGGL